MKRTIIYLFALAACGFGCAPIQLNNRLPSILGDGEDVAIDMCSVGDGAANDRGGGDSGGPGPGPGTGF